MDGPAICETDLYLFHQGTNYRSYRFLGAHSAVRRGRRGVRFAVWAPAAAQVRVVGDFNGWRGEGHAMRRAGESGVWTLFIPELADGAVYKYEIHTAGGETLLKADPYGFYAEVRPATASVVHSLEGYSWGDAAWYEKARGAAYERPMLTYEVHLGSWRRDAAGRPLTYRAMAEQLADYASQMGYTHIELMPLCEHPYDGSWGYQAIGYFAVTSRYGAPQDFMYLVDCCHRRGIGVILDWVPGHFCRDAHGLRRFDGGPLYESDNLQRSENAGWGTTNFDYGRPEVQSFLISNALFWFDVYHIDGLRIDAVANMLYLNYGREPGQWQPNKYGGSGNLEAMDFLRRLNTAVFEQYPQALMIAEESTSWPQISRPVYMGGMGFNFKWNMGWMNDILKYMEMDPVYRQWNHNLVTFSLMYAFSENFVLPLSHDEVVHGKRSLLDKMPGDYWQKFAGLRVFYAYWMAHPGKKLLFMGGEFGQFIEWKYDDSLDWHLLEYPMHQKLHGYVRALNALYRREKPLWQVDCEWPGFEWIDCHDCRQSVISFIRKAKDGRDYMIVVCNFTPEVRRGYRIGAPEGCTYEEILSSDEEAFGGSGVKNDGPVRAQPVPWHGRPYSIALEIPPLGAVYLKPLRAL